MNLRIDTANQKAFTLVELIFAMLVVSVAVVGVMSVISYTTRNSADPVLRQQSIAVAEAYLEEITLKNYTDPDADGEASRDLYDDIDDYDGLSDSGARDQNGNAIAGLSGYDVAVDITAQSFGPAGSTVAGLRIEVSVTDPAGETITLTSYRSNF